MFGYTELSRRIDRLEARTRRQDAIIVELCRRAGVSVDAVDPDTPDAEERRLVLAGKTIQAIKHHRERTGAGLKESKDAIDALRR